MNNAFEILSGMIVVILFIAGLVLVSLLIAAIHGPF